MICTDPTCNLRGAHDHDDDLAWFNAWAADRQRVHAAQDHLPGVRASAEMNAQIEALRNTPTKGK